MDRAIDIYFEHAYGSKPRKRFTEEADMLSAFADETRHDEDGQAGFERHTLRLGNRNYPFMKLVLQEHMVPGEFYFAVDTHDQMDIRPDFPDYEAWRKVQRFNFELKRKIEVAFHDAGVPTLASIRDHVVLDPVAPRRGEPLIFVVDDEVDEAEALERVLRNKGYNVARACDGREALERLQFMQPSLIILDYEMPELDGLTVIKELRSHESTRLLPILLTTASQVVAAEKSAADGFLPKPFRQGDLIDLVEHLLAR